MSFSSSLSEKVIYLKKSTENGIIQDEGTDYWPEPGVSQESTGERAYYPVK